MKDTLSGIVSMLESGEPEQRVAAAQVLTWLKPRNPAVVKALGKIAEDGDGFLRPYAVEALAAIGNAAALAHLIPLLHIEGPLRNKVARAFARQGEQSEKVLLRELEKADRETKAVILEILARTRGAEAIKAILAAMKDPEAVELGKLAAKYLLAECDALDGEEHEEERVRLTKTVLASLKRIPKKVSESYKHHLIEILAKVGDASCRTVFMANTGPSQPAEVRGAALRGLQRFELTPAQVSKVLGYLDEEDFIHVVGPSLAVLEDLEPSGAQMASALGKLLDNARPEVRLFAMKGLGQYATATSAKLLLPFLENDDARVRQLASDGLGRNPEAREGVVKMLVAARDLEEAMRPVDAAQGLAQLMTREQVKRLVQRFMKLMLADDPVRDVFQRVLSAADAEVVSPLLLDEARKLRSAMKYEEAQRVLQTLTGSEDDMLPDVRYELAITTLLMRVRQPELSEGDPVIGHFCHLIEHGYGLLAKVKRERRLETEDVLYLGQRFVERLNDERRFGTDLLTWLIKKEPEAKESVQAMQKLKVEGLA